MRAALISIIEGRRWHEVHAYPEPGAEVRVLRAAYEMTHLTSRGMSYRYRGVDHRARLQSGVRKGTDQASQVVLNAAPELMSTLLLVSSTDHIEGYPAIQG